MAVPQYGIPEGPRPAGAVPPAPVLDAGVTELRVHGVGGSTPAALLRDLAPQQVGGDRVAGFYRTADLKPDGDGAPRQVEGYAWGGMTSRSGTRVLWLLLLPFLLANLAGWMYRGEPSGARYACHRVVTNLACLALTVNTVLVAIMLGPNLITYQAPRAGLAHGQFWLWPLSWTWVAGHGERPLVIGYATVVLAILVLIGLAVLTQRRYESVEPPWRVDAGSTKSRRSAADTRLTDREFWNSALAVRRMTWAHLSAAGGFLAVVFAVTARAASAQAPRGLGWWWVAVLGGGLALAVSVVVVAADRWLGAVDPGSVVLRVFNRLLAPVAVVCATVFALHQPEVSRAAGSLPGLDTIVAATYAALGACVLLMILTGLPAKNRGGPGPVVVMLLAIGLLNALLLGLLFTFGHALGGLHADAAPAPTVLNVPIPIGWAGPLLTLTLFAGLLVWVLTQAIRATFFMRDPRDAETDFAGYRAQQPVDRDGPDKEWYVTAEREQPWRRRLTWLYRFGELRSAVPALLWLIVGFQLAAVVWTIIAQPPVPDAWFSPNGALGKVTVFAGDAVLLGVMWLLRNGWRDPARRRLIGVLWDVGTFWPRSFHPFAPPCYAERAVPDLQRRIWRLNDHGTRVVLVGHSQGAILSTVALLPRGCRALHGKIALVTFGNPDTWLYSWAFPGWFNPAALAHVFSSGANQSCVTEWRNFWYPTDPIGAAVSVAGDTVHDTRLRDPRTAWYIYGDPAPAAGGHSGYWTDGRVWDEVDQVAKRLCADGQTGVP
ncbi:hypothetical protein [Amycolatopsis pithecellobii]|uniref:Integral membrane protein n=1 Tax=Amycolatopsis pithecellobii TaxID=664692 RepID=A0A6N7YV22_9PSEU|nr:hypothetical protein [Amycolatopsis pithecellobii]MTD55792.1 hypothetical protein [Amycolatopsis pithecellobii]